MKLSKAQRDFLVLTQGIGCPAVEYHKPALKLLELGLVTKEERKSSLPLFRITEKGIRALEGRD